MLFWFLVYAFHGLHYERVSPLKSKTRRRLLRGLLATVLAAALLFAFYVFLQTVVAHRPGTFFTPDYDKEDLSSVLSHDPLTEDDYIFLFLQTGLGKPAVDKLLSSGESGKAVLLQIQEQFFAPYELDCAPLLGLFTREDHLKDDAGKQVYAPYLADYQPGDIILTRSTHSLGWRHGHAGLVVQTENGLLTLESVVLGTNSTLMNPGHWRRYSNYAVLRVKDLTEEERRACADKALEQLLDVPYHLTAGFIGPKAQDPDSPFFGLHCSYLVWYAWNAMGVDLDSDGGPLASTTDLLHSDRLEIVQLYGMDPRSFIPPQSD